MRLEAFVIELFFIYLLMPILSEKSIKSENKLYVKNKLKGGKYRGGKIFEFHKNFVLEKTARTQ